MKKILTITLAALVAIVLVFGFAKNMIIKASVESGVKLVTGLNLNIRKFDLSIMKTYIGIEDLKLYNPKGYEDKVMIHIPEIYIDYDLPSIFQGTIHLEEMRLNMNELIIIKNKDGILNLDSLKVAQGEPTEKKAEEPKEKGEAPQIQLDNLDLKIGKVIFKDYSKGGEPVVKVYNLNIQESHQNITDLNVLVSLIVAKALTKATLAGLTQVDFGDLQGSLGGAMDSGKQLAAMGSDKLGESSKSITDSLKETTSKLKEKLKLF